jgi:hypothetical protein
MCSVAAILISSHLDKLNSKDQWIDLDINCFSIILPMPCQGQMIIGWESNLCNHAIYDTHVSEYQTQVKADREKRVGSSVKKIMYQEIFSYLHCQSFVIKVVQKSVLSSFALFTLKEYLYIELE